MFLGKCKVSRRERLKTILGQKLENVYGNFCWLLKLRAICSQKFRTPSSQLLNFSSLILN